MKKETFLFILKLYLCYLLVFLLFKPIFMLYNAPDGLQMIDYLRVLWHGLPLDLSTAAYFVVVPFVVVLLSSWLSMGKKGLHLFFIIYYSITALIISVGLCVDCVLYDFWGFKLDATVLNYIDSPKDVIASVSVWLVILGMVAILVVATFIVWLLIKLSHRYIQECIRPDKVVARTLQTLLLILMGGVVFIFMRGGLGKSTMNIGKVFYSETQFLNHSAVNPIFSFFSSALKTQDFSNEYKFFDEKTATQLYAQLQMPNESTATTADSMKSVLNTNRPNIVLIVVEGFSANFIQVLGGREGTTPYFDHLSHQGILFSQCYANSFRTDRGTVSILSGYPAFPNISIMKIPEKSRALPSLAKSLKQAGYSTSFLYGGDINFTNMNSYLLSTGYDRVQGISHFPPTARTSHAWGAQDHIMLDTLAHQIITRYQQPGPFFMTALTLSSHEPWVVPYHRISGDVRANAMAYTDSCLGVFINVLKNSPAWNNLLVVLVADHGITYPAGITEADPLKSHIPMLWVGGALRQPQQISKYCNQSDLAATLLHAMQLPHKQYHFSRNILSDAYRYPFAMHTFSGGMAFIDSTGATIYDLTANKVMTDTPKPSAARLHHAKVYLQKTMQDFARLER